MADGHSLTGEQITAAVRELAGESEMPAVKADFLAGLAAKGETPAEISAFALALREMSVIPPIDAATRSRGILDVCGTGGDRLNTFNISTTVALVMAAAGVTVAKHGNRAITSQAGSADVLEALGVKIDLTPERAAASLRDHHFAFFFAPNYHPAFKQIAPARKLCAERGQRTIFNFLGPLLNPAHPTAQLMGVPRRELCEPIAYVLETLGVRRGMVVCGAVVEGSVERYLDEFSTLGENHVAELTTQKPSQPGNVTRLPNAQITVRSIPAQLFPVQPAKLADLSGSDRKSNAAIVRLILHGEERGPRRDAVLLNCGAAMVVAGKATTMKQGWEMAEDVIDSGKAAQKLAELLAASETT